MSPSWIRTRCSTAARFLKGGGSCARPCTSSPLDTRCSARWLPAKPVMPVMSTRSTAASCHVWFAVAPASDGALIVPTTIPVLTALAASFVGERLTATKLAGFALASIGAALVILAGQTGDEVSSRRLVGDLLMLLGACCWAVYTVLGTIALRTRSPLAIVTIAAPVGAALLIPLGFFETGYADVAGWSTAVWLNVLYLALAGSVASFIVFYWVVRRVGAGVAAMTSYLVPVLTLAMAVVFLGDRPQALQLVGGVVILAGVRLATWRLTQDSQPIPEGAA